MTCQVNKDIFVTVIYISTVLYCSSKISKKNMNFDNVIYLPGEPGDELHSFRACSEVVPMSTYEELQLIVSVALLIVAILTYTHKK